MAAKTKKDYLEEAAGLGIDVSELADEGEEPTVEQLRDAINSVTQEVPQSTDLFLLLEPTLAVPFAGLLAAEPHLREAELKPSEWRAELNKYLKSERP